MKEKKQKKPKKRELTAAEKRRQERFELMSAGLIRQGYTREDLLITMTEANIKGLLMILPFCLIEAILFFRRNGVHGFSSEWQELILMVGLLLVEIVVHELIHGITWGCFARRHFHAISFGVIWKQLTPYCTCADPLTKGQYIIGGLMPTIILGIGTTWAAIAMDSFLLLYVSIVITAGGAGDILIVWKLLRQKAHGKQVVYCDHPTEGGLVAFVK